MHEWHIFSDWIYQRTGNLSEYVWINRCMHLPDVRAFASIFVKFIVYFSTRINFFYFTQLFLQSTQLNYLLYTSFDLNNIFLLLFLLYTLWLFSSRSFSSFRQKSKKFSLISQHSSLFTITKPNLHGHGWTSHNHHKGRNSHELNPFSF